jgi:hypothetical protein
MRFRPDRYICPVCKWDFACRRKKCCPGCGTLLLITSDMLSDEELTALKSFWMWENRKGKNNRVIPSMSRPANPYDNASCESFMKTLKREEIYANKYDDLENLRANIEEFIEQYYNRLRLHSALGYRSPEEFEQQIEASGSAESRSATMVFFENKENSKKINTGLLGKGTQVPSPSPDPFSC